METILGQRLRGKLELKNSDGFKCVLNIKNGELIERCIETQKNGLLQRITLQVIRGKMIQSQMQELRKSFFSFVGTNHGKYLHTVGVLELDSQDGFHVKKEICICGINNGIWFSDKEKTVKLYKKWKLPFKT